MFRITKHIEFCYGHRLLNYAGKCRYLHGHNGKAVITIEEDPDGRRRCGNDNGCCRSRDSEGAGFADRTHLLRSRYARGTTAPQRCMTTVLRRSPGAAHAHVAHRGATHLVDAARP